MTWFDFQQRHQRETDRFVAEILTPDLDLCIGDDEPCREPVSPRCPTKERCWAHLLLAKKRAFDNLWDAMKEALKYEGIGE
jgi:hypothetical protein